MTNNGLPNSDNEKLMRLLKGYQAEQEKRNRVRRARYARIQQAKRLLTERMQEHNAN